MIDLVTQLTDGIPTPLALGFLLLGFDLLIGDPAWLYKRIPHPVIPIGNLIGWLEARLNRSKDHRIQFGAGLLTSILVVILVASVGIVISALLDQVPFGGILLAILGSSLIACKGLYQAVANVEAGLSTSLQEGRKAVSHIVGRDPDSLDEAGVARASIESLAENFLDGTVSPLFWFLIAGLPGLLVYKAVNTLDSMIGHRNDRFEYFGKFAARLDDVMNYIPARLTGLLIAGSSLFLRNADFRAAFQVLFKDARLHKSVNAGWQEAAMAGALGISLAGPRQYGGRLTEDHWMNSAGRKDVTPLDIRRALTLYQVTTAYLFVLLVIIAVLSVR
ncbi:adenosylcobinamide-phosphate synthase CbiB [Sneathiella limimaris]|uniref:adenosylcobinamide-phosphate synthase CbiB n=1 Tax=Sneathiella limimaris TaxID=1964213 RepID=UPI00146A3BC7|nr:adenosylcobinamide-phosphate synthase CbiB [Sneathiella limimaris]